MNSYELSRAWFDWCFDNPDKIKPNHTALYFFCIEHCNRLGWKEKFGLPTEMAKEAIGIKSYNTYINTLNELIEFGFLKLVQKSTNQYSANIVALSNFNKAHNKALDKATLKHMSKQRESTGESIDSIDKPLTIEQLNQEPLNGDCEILINISFSEFWDLYDKKVGDKTKLEKKWEKLTDKEREQAMNHTEKYKLSQPEKRFRKDPETYLNNKSFNDEIIYSDASSSNQSGRSQSRHQAGLNAALNGLKKEAGII